MPLRSPACPTLGAADHRLVSCASYSTPPVAAAAAAASGADSGGKSDLSPPDYWTPRKADVDLVPIDLKSKEATDVLKSFHATIKRKVCTQLRPAHGLCNWGLHSVTAWFGLAQFGEILMNGHRQRMGWHGVGGHRAGFCVWFVLGRYRSQPKAGCSSSCFACQCTASMNAEE